MFKDSFTGTGPWYHRQVSRSKPYSSWWINHTNPRGNSWHNHTNVMTSSNGNIFALLAICAENSPVTGQFPAQRPVTRNFMFFFICAWINGWVKNGDAGELRRHRAHYQVTVMKIAQRSHLLFENILYGIYLKSCSRVRANLWNPRVTSQNTVYWILHGRRCRCHTH